MSMFALGLVVIWGHTACSLHNVRSRLQVVWLCLTLLWFQLLCSGQFAHGIRDQMQRDFFDYLKDGAEVCSWVFWTTLLADEEWACQWVSIIGVWIFAWNFHHFVTFLFSTWWHMLTWWCIVFEGGWWGSCTSTTSAVVPWQPGMAPELLSHAAPEVAHSGEVSNCLTTWHSSISGCFVVRFNVFIWLLCVKPKLQCSNWLISFDWTERAVMSILFSVDVLTMGKVAFVELSLDL